MRHEWTMGRGLSKIVLKPADPAAVAAHARPGVRLMSITELWVPSHARRRGYGTALMLGATQWAVHAGVDLWLYCAPFDAGADKTALINFYIQHGFKRVAWRSPDYEMIKRC